jgi:hypothetical protein
MLNSLEPSRDQRERFAPENAQEVNHSLWSRLGNTC